MYSLLYNKGAYRIGSSVLARGEQVVVKCSYYIATLLNMKSRRYQSKN